MLGGYHHGMSHRITTPPEGRRPATYALIQKRAEISGELKAKKLEIRRLIEALDHIDYTIHLFDSGYEIATIRDIPKLTNNFRGDTSKILLDALREADRPLNTEELAIKLVDGRHLDSGDPKIVNLFRARAGSTLQFQRGKGLVRSTGRVGKMNLWELVR
jgi:hypothetical protein